MDVGRTVVRESPVAVFEAKRPFLGLQFRFTILVVVVALSVVLVVAGALFDVAANLADRQQRDDCVASASLMATSLAEPLHQGDEAALQELVDQFVTAEAIHFVAVTDPCGATVVLADPEDRRHEGSAGALPGHHDATLGTPVFHRDGRGDTGHVELAYPISTVDPERREQRLLLGYLQVAYPGVSTRHQLAASFDLLTGLILGAALLAIPLAYLVVRRVVDPINRLARVVRCFASGELTARTSIRRHDEIGLLAGAFNAMADQLAQQHRQVLGLNAELEERVRRRTRQLRELASRDPLTGLYNRRHFDEVLRQRYSEALRYESDLSCMMLDLDDFKQINDRNGHHTGDEVLILAATTIACQLRAADVAARFGGDEFIILLPQTDAARADYLASRIVEKFAVDISEQLPDVSVSLSIGIASMVEARPETPDQLIRAADRALYQAKRDGKGRIAMAPAAT